MQKITGFVERIMDGIGYVTIKTEDGQEYEAEIKANKLEQAGIEERDRFEGTLGLDDKEIIKKLPPLPINEQEIAQRIEKSLKGLDSEDDY